MIEIDQNTIEIEFDNGEIILCTSSHKWYVENNEGQIVIVNTLELLNGTYSYILTEDDYI